MEILDWITIDSWKAGKLAIMVGILLYHSFFRWVPFLAVRKTSTDKTNLFVAHLKLTKMPWSFFANIFHIALMLTFGLLSWKLNKASWPLYSLLFIGSIEIILYLIIGISSKLFSLVMGKNSIILSNGYLTSIQLKEVKKIEKKYTDELYFTMNNGEVTTINYNILSKDEMTEFLLKLKNNTEIHNIYFANDLLDTRKH